jgi:peptide/nickel transport system ATP-binding protein
LVKAGKQIQEAVLAHRKVSRAQAKKQAIEMMRQVGLPDPEQLYETYPHQLSGGQRQRIMIAMAFVNQPALLIADEPTTALDVTIQAQILELMRTMNREKKSAVLLISHDLGVVKKLCSRAYIMYAGHIVESGRVETILKQPLHPYTKGLVAAIPAARKRGEALASIPGSVPALSVRPKEGCAFCERCAWAMDICKTAVPVCRQEKDRQILCHRTIAQLKEGGDDAGRTDSDRTSDKDVQG